MRRLGLLLATLCALLLGAPANARAAESKCPLPLSECMLQYAELRDRGWLGIEVERDTTTKIATIVRVIPGGPADKAGLKAGDVIQKTSGYDQKWIAGKAGWKDAKPVQVAVLRSGASVTLPVQCGMIPEDYLAHMIGVHVLEGHVAYMDKAERTEVH
jgi:predicted metalloprotease with PDZ domain